MIKIKKESDEVLYPDESIVCLNNSDIEILRDLAINNSRQRIRLCAHPDSNDLIHEMFIIHTSNCYVRPHRHINKPESMTILLGEADVVLFEESGEVEKVIQMGDLASGKLFYYRLNQPIYHTLIIKSDFILFHEVTRGPFIRKMTEFPDWAPNEEDPFKEKFINELKNKISKFSKYV